MTFTRSLGALLILVSLSAAPVQAQAESSSSPADLDDDVPSFGQLFTGTLANFGRLPTIDNVMWIAIGGGAALATHGADPETTRALSDAHGLSGPLKAGAVIGGTPFELGSAFATYGLGRAFHKRRAALVGADLIKAQLMAEAFTLGIKETARRSRPSGSGFSFPSGHTTVTFASATVLQRHFGWRVGIPAYVVASYVATSRIQNRRHYLSDVAFGAALGMIAGRTTTMRHLRGFEVAPVVAPGVAEVLLTWTRP